MGIPPSEPPPPPPPPLPEAPSPLPAMRTWGGRLSFAMCCRPCTSTSDRSQQTPIRKSRRAFDHHASPPFPSLPPHQYLLILGGLYCLEPLLSKLYVLNLCKAAEKVSSGELPPSHSPLPLPPWLHPCLASNAAAALNILTQHPPPPGTHTHTHTHGYTHTHRPSLHSDAQGALSVPPHAKDRVLRPSQDLRAH